ncbi:MAG: lysylphosphatidylglycerol synthase domain-containing protein [Pedobacter sp.]|nr:lysylphosphatidylglycerol synthase domain-containing protein [Pedobacter sp.]MDQ8053641.1 lysylphosphatidylglycerol synthase domain-containing protein [Pedobacter sp.]
MTAQYKKIVSVTLKIVIVVLAFWFIYKKLLANKDLRAFGGVLENKQQSEIAMVVGLVCLLMLFNWGLEAWKWKRLISPVERISLWLAIESVFCGLTWAIFTPNRLGEYGGRVFFLSPKRRVAGIVAMTVGNMGQLVLTNVFGAVAACIFLYRFKSLDYHLFLAVCALGLAFCLFFLIFFFNIKWLKGLLLSMRWTRKYQKFYAVLGRYSKRELFKILAFCMARYLVFSIQYYILFQWLIPDLYFSDIMVMVSLLFFVQSALPSLDFLDVGIRSYTAAYLFGYITSNLIAVIAVTASIWLVNLIVPAILGSFFVFKLRFFGNYKRV